MKNYNVTAYVLLKVKFKQPTNDIYKLAKITEDFCSRTIKDARKKVKILEVGMKKKLKLLLRL